MPCFLDDEDRQRYLQCLLDALARFDCRLHAYVLMDNHVHLLMTPEDAGGVSRLMHTFARNYAVLFNRRHGRTGTLWEGRYKACLIDSESYFLACSRYIELNPMRAWIAADPADYPWSSYRANAGGAFDPLLSPHPCYLALGPDRIARGGLPIGACSTRLCPQRWWRRSDGTCNSRRRWVRIGSVRGWNRERGALRPLAPRDGRRKAQNVLTPFRG